MSQSESTSSSSSEAVKTDTNMRRSRTALNRRYFKTRVKSLK